MTSRQIFLLTLAFFGSIVWLVTRSNLHKPSWRDWSQNIGLGDHYAEPPPQVLHPHVEFKPGTTNPPGVNYTRSVVMAKAGNDDVEWMNEDLQDLDKKIYVVDDASAPLHPPKNKGHEVMVYFSYIIDFYDDLPDVVMFMHSHQFGWHNPDMLDHDAVHMMLRLSSDKVVRDGYVSMRCQWDPGCPDWIHPGETVEQDNRREEILIAKAWAEIFPTVSVPNVLAQPCCSQFALSRERIRAIPRETYEFYRDWLLNTAVRDTMSGRIWEYSWQYLFAGVTTFCPNEFICMCDTYGVCFRDEEAYTQWFKFKDDMDELNKQIREWQDQFAALKQAMDEGRLADASSMDKPESGKDRSLQGRIDSIQYRQDQLLKEALIRGREPKNRADTAGRSWKDGDGF